MAEAQDKLAQAKEALDREVRRAYQHYAYLVRDEEGQLEVRYGRFDSDSVSALVGADVWAGLVAAGRAAPVSGLSTDAMLVALAGELPRSLAEVTRLFWTDAQKMLLASDNVLRQALFDALARGRLELIDAAGVLQDVPSGPEDLPLRSSLQRLRWSTADQRAGAHSPGDSAYEAGKEAGGDHAHVDEPGSGPSYDPDAVSGTGTSGEAVTNGSAAGARAELFLRTAADVTDIDLRAAMQGLLRRMANNTDDGYVEAVELTVRLIGSKEQVAEIQALAGQLPGSQIRLDDLPD